MYDENHTDKGRIEGKIGENVPRGTYFRVKMGEKGTILSIYDVYICIYSVFTKNQGFFRGIRKWNKRTLLEEYK